MSEARGEGRGGLQVEPQGIPQPGILQENYSSSPHCLCQGKRKIKITSKIV